MEIKIVNISNITQKIFTHSTNFTLLVGLSKIIHLSSSSIITAKSKNYDESNNEYTYKIPIGPSKMTVYVTNNGLFDEFACSLIDFQNNSDIPLMLIEDGINGRRWPQMLVYPYKSVQIYVTKNTRWELIHPSEEQLPITMFFIEESFPKKIFFDGNHIKFI